MSFAEKRLRTLPLVTDFGDDLVPLTCLRQNLVVYLTSEGRSRARRSLSATACCRLSRANAIGDNHSMRLSTACTLFGADGLRGGAGAIEPGLNLPMWKSYPGAGTPRIVFIWMGDADKARPALAFDLPSMGQEGWQHPPRRTSCIFKPTTECGQNLVGPLRHVKLWIQPDDTCNAALKTVPVHVKTADERARGVAWSEMRKPMAFSKKHSAALPARRHRWHYYYLHMPSTRVIDVGSSEAKLELPEVSATKGVWRIFALHFVTPVTEDYRIRPLDCTCVTPPLANDARRPNGTRCSRCICRDKGDFGAVHQVEQRPKTQNPFAFAIDKAPAMSIGKNVSRRIEAEATDDSGTLFARCLSNTIDY